MKINLCDVKQISGGSGGVSPGRVGERDTIEAQRSCGDGALLIIVTVAMLPECLPCAEVNQIVVLKYV